MNTVVARVGVAFWGLVTAALVAAVNAAIVHRWGINLFSFSLFYVAPVGAFFCGMFAAIGSYQAAKRFGVPATPSLGWQMVIVAAAMPILSHWLVYQWLTTADGTRVADVVPFAGYLKVMLTSVHFSMKFNDMGEVGSFGYVLAVVQFAGLLIGAFGVYLLLTGKHMCQPCARYFDAVHAPKKRCYAGPDSAQAYYAQLPLLAPGSDEFTGLLKADAGLAEDDANYVIDTQLIACPGCKLQALEETVKIREGKKWKDLDELKRLIHLPAGVDLAPAFKAD